MDDTFERSSETSGQSTQQVLKDKIRTQLGQTIITTTITTVTVRTHGDDEAEPSNTLHSPQEGGVITDELLMRPPDVPGVSVNKIPDEYCLESLDLSPMTPEFKKD